MKSLFFVLKNMNDMLSLYIGEVTQSLLKQYKGNKMKKIFKDLNAFEIIFLFVSLLVITLCFAFGVDKNL